MHACAAQTAAKLAARREAALAAARRPALDMSAGSRRLLAGARAGFSQRLQVRFTPPKPKSLSGPGFAQRLQVQTLGRRGPGAIGWVAVRV